MVELRIFEGEGSNKTDITFQYNAHFFCFATLEHAPRVMGGRPHHTAPQQQPVLTGMPVSGMAYLDRPAEAGYFIFPDLSVRHEGKYVLDFTLYEQTKDEKDQDPDKPDPNSPEAQDMPAGSFDYRLSVKSLPFTVFSAKKFPGLAESTMLSRTVAEQGCRVRIRRDVRMRRREGKGGDTGYDDYEDGGFSRARSSTPAAARHRAASNASVDRQPFDQRRSSNAFDNANPYSTNYNAAAAPPQPSAPFGGFGSQPANQAHFPAPQFTQPASASAQANQPYQQFRPQNGQSGFPYQERSSYSQPQAARDGAEDEFRRGSTNFSAPIPAKIEQDNGHPYPAFQSRPEPPVLAPIKVAPTSQSTYEVTPVSASNRASASVQSPGFQKRPNFSAFPAPTTAQQRTGSKRSFDSVFPTSNQPLHNGMRPTSSQGSRALPDMLEADNDAYNMNYKRADGSNHNRELPPLLA